MDLAVVRMAAGMGRRVGSKMPEVLQSGLGKPLLYHVLGAAKPLEPVETVIIVGHKAEQVQAEFETAVAGQTRPISFVVQSPQLGTGHAVQQTSSLLSGKADVILVIPGDLPLLTSETFQKLVDAYQAAQAPLAMLTVEADNPRGFGRIARDSQGYVTAIVEEVDCTPEQKAIRELNVGAYVFEADWLWANLEKIPLNPKGEYYITDLVGIAVEQAKRVVPKRLADPVEAMGINNRLHLAEVEAALRRRINQKWLETGVTMIDPATTYIDLEVMVGPDTVIYPNTYLFGQTTIGQDCTIGPGSFIEDSTIGDGCMVRFSVVEEAVLEDEVDIGPFAHLHKGTHLARGSILGTNG